MSLEIRKKRGLASASEETRIRVARSGGVAAHEKRGLQTADQETRMKVARQGGLALGARRRAERNRHKLPPEEIKT